MAGGPAQKRVSASLKSSALETVEHCVPDDASEEGTSLPLAPGAGPSLCFLTGGRGKPTTGALQPPFSVRAMPRF